jgi:hypothetical protein
MVCTFGNGRETGSEKPVAVREEESLQAICNPHVECYEFSTAREIREIQLVINQASFLESVWSSNMEIIH